MSPLPATHNESYRVRSYHLDERMRLSVGALLSFLQDAAGLHANRLGVSMVHLGEDNLTWMLHRLKVEIHSQPSLHETVSVETWPCGFLHAVALRDFIVRTQSGTPVATATSRWAMVSLDTRRAVRIPQHVAAIATDLPQREPQLETPRLSGPLDQIDHSCEFAVRRSDLDMLDHVNNVRYGEWAAQSVPDEVWNSRRLAALDVLFRSESRYGDRIRAETESTATNGAATFNHRLRRTKDGLAVVHAISRWV